MVFVANDIESGGPKLGVHPTLSIGAAVVVREEMPFEEYFKRGLVFYSEMIPDSFVYDEESMRIGCLHLDCLEEAKRSDPRYDARSREFNSRAVLKLMEERCESPVETVARLHKWLSSFAKGEEIVGVTDTVFFDSGRLDLLFGIYSPKPSPYGWRGRDLTSLYQGWAGDPNARLKSVGVADERKRPHRADEDAVHLAQITRELLFERLGW